MKDMTGCVKDTTGSKAVQSEHRYEFFAPCPKGLDKVAASELRALGIKVRPLTNGVSFFGTLKQAYMTCLYSRVCSRVLLVLTRTKAKGADELYKACREIAWEEQVSPRSTIAVDAHGTTDQLRNTQFSALLVKDAICDRLLEMCGKRPNVDKHHPDISISARINERGATVYLNLSGAPLHERGYRAPHVQAEAPLKETLAAGMLLLAGWDTLCAPGRQNGKILDVAPAAATTSGDSDAQAASAASANVAVSATPVVSTTTTTTASAASVTNDTLSASAADDTSAASAVPTTEAAPATTATPSTPFAFFDPLCGSGTLCIEAALIAARIAPGLLRTTWGFSAWLKHDEALWRALVERARAEKETGLALLAAKGRIMGSDIDPRAVQLARDNAHRAGLGSCLHFSCCSVEDFVAHAPRAASSTEAEVRALVATNPPYGVRIGQRQQLPALYHTLCTLMNTVLPNWRFAAITPDESFEIHFGSRPAQAIPLYNGPIVTTLKVYPSFAESRAEQTALQLNGQEVLVTDKNAEQFANRLKKRAGIMKKWARKQGIYAYRVYDADLPDFNVSVDYYAGAGEYEGDQRVLITEYAAPSEIDSEKSASRLADVLRVVPVVLDVEQGDCVLRERRRRTQDASKGEAGAVATGRKSESKSAANRRGGTPCSSKGGAEEAVVRHGEGSHNAQEFYVREHGFIFELNFMDYLDTGLFLDHRPVRALIYDSLAACCKEGAANAQNGEAGINRHDGMAACGKATAINALNREPNIQRQDNPTDYSTEGVANALNGGSDAQGHGSLATCGKGTAAKVPGGEPETQSQREPHNLNRSQGRQTSPAMPMMRLPQMARVPRFLNLFSYTATASVYAAAAGAHTTTVDMSGVYLDWAQRNMQHNGFAVQRLRLRLNHAGQQNDSLPASSQARRGAKVVACSKDNRGAKAAVYSKDRRATMAPSSAVPSASSEAPSGTQCYLCPTGKQHLLIQADCLQWLEGVARVAQQKDVHAVTFNDAHKGSHNDACEGVHNDTIKGGQNDTYNNAGNGVRNGTFPNLPSLQQASTHWDFIYIDPPTFSNSKRMKEKSWDVQRDHVALLTKAAVLLNPGGVILFSCNLRSFKIDADALASAGLSVKDISAQTIDKDFERNSKIHRCYVIKRS